VAAIDRWLAIVNPAAGGGRCAALAPSALAQLRASGLTVDEAQTSAQGDAKRIARDAYRNGIRGFIAVGGDGTGYEVVNGLLPDALGAADAARPCLAFMPLGTGNSFLRDFGGGGAEQARAALSAGRRRPCDAVRLTYEGGELYFINLLSAGFVADVCTTANRRFKRLGAAGYALSVVLETAGLAPRGFRMRVDGGAPWQQQTTFVSFCNSRYTGGTMMMAPFADTADGKLDVIVAGAMSRFGLLAAFPKIFAGTHVHLPSVACSQARSIEIDADAAIDLMIDGEVERHKPQRLEVVPGAIDVSV
jgi:YegS/Rv2252/BmrU family lipid kinase